MSKAVVAGSRAPQAAVLTALLQATEPMSISQLCRVTTMSRPTVSRAVDALVCRRLVAADQLSESTAQGGRPGRQFRPASREYLVAAVVIARRRISLVLTDLDGNEVSGTELAIAADYRDVADIPKTVINLVESSMSAQGDLQLCCIVVSVLGVVAQERILVRSGLLRQLEGTGLHDQLVEHFQTTVIIENDANLAALAESCELEAPEMMIGLLVGADFGCGIVINGQLHHGASGAAGELQLGIWEQLWALLRSPAAGTVANQDIFERANSLDPEAIAFVSEVARLIAEGLVPIVEFFDPDRLVIGGEGGLAGRHIAEPLRAYLMERIGSSPVISTTKLGARTVMTGAILLGCRRGRAAVLRLE